MSVQQPACKSATRQGDRRPLVVQICEDFGAYLLPFQYDDTRQRQMNAEVTARLRELQTTIEAGVLS